MGLPKQLSGVVSLTGLGLKNVWVIPGPHHQSSVLGELVIRCASEEGMFVSISPLPSSSTLGHASIWDCPFIELTGPPLGVQYTTLDRPDLLHPRYISLAVSMLHRLVELHHQGL
jgi:hypothetical protein